MSGKASAYIAVIVQVCIIGFSFLFVKVALEYTDAVDILAHRFLFAFAAIAVITALRRKKLGLTPKKVLVLLPLAIFYPVLSFLTQTLGLMYMPSAEAGIIQALLPVFAAIAAFFILRERIRPVQAAGIALAVGGAIFITVMQGATAAAFDIRGTLFMVVSTISLALYNVLTRKLVRQYSPFTLTFVITLLGMLVFNGVSLGMHAAGGTVGAYFAPLSQPGYTGPVLYLGVLASVCTTLLAGYALARIDASRASVFMNLGVVITIFAGVAILGETVYWYHIVGTAVIVAGVLGTNFGASKKRVRIS